MTFLQQSDRQPPLAWLAVNAAVWAVLVAAFAAAFEVRKTSVDLIGRTATDAVPLLLAGAAAAAAGCWAWRLRSTLDLRIAALAAAAFLTGLLTTDPQFPAKRLHVPEYALLALLVWLALDRRLDRPSRAFVAFAVAFLLGGLEELIQGVLASRTYGLADIATNGFGAASGALFAASFGAARHGPRSGGGSVRWTKRLAGLAPGFAVLTGAVLLLTAFHRYRDLAIAVPLWAVLPLAAAACIALLPVAGGRGAVQAALAFRLVACTMLGLALWIHASGVDFR